MKLDFSKELFTIGKTPITHDGKKTTLGFISREALLSVYEDETGVSGEEKYRRFKLAERCEGEVDLVAEDIAKIKLLVGKRFAAGIVGPVFDALEGKE